MTTLADQAWKVGGVGDFDGDGKSDLLWRNSNNGFNGLWKSANSGTQHPVVNVTNVAWRVAQVADFDGDGRSDIAWRNATNGANAIWKSANVNTQQTVATVSSQAWGVVPVERQPLIPGVRDNEEGPASRGLFSRPV